MDGIEGGGVGENGSFKLNFLHIHLTSLTLDPVAGTLCCIRWHGEGG